MIKLTYRPEIDGLRALAVVSVIIYHLEFFFLESKVLQGGFIGVDIFFVISGYLITSILIKEVSLKGKFSLLDFYERRARRILPALFVTISISIFFAWKYLIPSFFIQFVESAISSVFFFSNYFFYFEGLIYNNQESLLKPLLHTWSLSVEEQFYIFFPISLILINKFLNKKFFLFFILSFILSFFLSIYTTSINDNFSFFSTISRGWEFLAGSLLFYIQFNIKKIEFRYHNLFTLIGLICIFFSFIYFNENTFHPSIMTLIPVIGTCLIIFFAVEKSYVTKFLSNFFLVKIGLISYSLYLWHFPVFAFARNKNEIISNFDKIELIFITIALSTLSYFFIERPFRNKKLISIKILITFISIFISFFIYFLIMTSKTNGFEGRFHVFLNSNQSEKIEYSLKDEKGTCFEREENFCNFNNTSHQAIILIGDSHAGILSKNLYDITKNKNVNFISITRGSCIYLPSHQRLSIKSKKEFWNCSSKSKDLIEKIIDSKKNPIIIIAGYYEAHLSENNSSTYFNESNLKPTQGLVNSINDLLKNDNKVILVYPIPTPGFHVIKKLAKHVPKINFDADNFLKKNPLFFSFSEYQLNNKRIINSFNSLQHRNLIKIFPDKIFCDQKNKTCKTHNGSDVFYRDEHHLTSRAVEILNKDILHAIDNFLTE